MVAGLGLGNGHLGAEHDSRRVLPRGAFDGPVGGESACAPRTFGEGFRELTRLGSTLRLDADRGFYLRSGLRSVLAELRLGTATAALFTAARQWDHLRSWPHILKSTYMTPTRHKHRAVGTANHRVGDASHHSPLHPA